MMTKNRRIFVDTSVVFAAVLSATGGARKLFLLGEAGVLHLMIGPSVLRECEAVVRRKAPASLPRLAVLLELGRVAITTPFTPAAMVIARAMVAYEPDAYVLAEAIEAGPDWFITHDKAHFLKSNPGSSLPFRTGTPGDLIQALEEEFRQP